jgi:hypothetical protein
VCPQVEVEHVADSQTLLLRGEVIEVSQRAGRRTLTVALEPHSLVASTGVPEDTHLGDHVRVEAEIRVVNVAPELPPDRRDSGRRAARASEEET